MMLGQYLYVSLDKKMEPLELGADEVVDGPSDGFDRMIWSFIQGFRLMMNSPSFGSTNSLNSPSCSSRYDRRVNMDSSMSPSDIWPADIWEEVEDDVKAEKKEATVDGLALMVDINDFLKYRDI